MIIGHVYFVLGLIAIETAVRFDPKSQLPDNVTLLEDDSPDTCTTFGETTTVAGYTNIRWSVGQIDTDINVTLVGNSLGCDYNLYLMSLNEQESTKWTGKWKNCELIRQTPYDNKEMCSFRCQDSAECKEIQVLKVPRTTEESSWTLCTLLIDNTLPVDCSDIKETESGVYWIKMSSEGASLEKTEIYCDMETDGGGWTVLLRRKDGSVDFIREWDDYRDGFGSLLTEFWIGNEVMNRITTNGRSYSLRVDLQFYDGNSSYAFYSSFLVRPESENYTLNVGGFSSNSTARDCLTSHNGMMFSTPSRDNDIYANGNCAELHKSPWWYRLCHVSLLTGQYGQYPDIRYNDGIKWCEPYDFPSYATMMIRPIT